MDRATLAAYDAGAGSFADKWHAQPPPDDLHAIILRFFHKGPTADIGCGSGRDVAWLNANGYPAVGYDAAPGMLDEARRRHRKHEFYLSSLPELDGVAANAFDNVLCETVLMHLPRDMVPLAVRRLANIVRPAGVLYLTWRVFADDTRDSKGRLYSALDSAVVRHELPTMTLLLDEEVASASSGNIIHRIVARK